MSIGNGKLSKLDWIMLLKKTRDKSLNEVRKTIKDTIEDKKYDWRIVIIAVDSLITLKINRHKANYLS